MKFLPLIAVLFLAGCVADTVPAGQGVSGNQINLSTDNGSEIADFDAISRAADELSKSTEPAARVLAKQISLTAKDGSARAGKLQTDLNTLSDSINNPKTGYLAQISSLKQKDIADVAAASSWKSNVAWGIAIIGLFAVAASVGLTADGIGATWAKGIGIGGGVLVIGGAILAVIIPGLAIIMLWTTGALAAIVVCDIVYLLVKNKGSLIAAKQQATFAVASAVAATNDAAQAKAVAAKATTAVKEVVSDIAAYKQPAVAYSPGTTQVVAAVAGDTAALPVGPAAA